MKGARGAALIIVIFAMMLFAVLGWTLANLQTGDFEANLRNFDSTQALSLAEAGSQWALNQLSQDTCWRTRSGIGGPYCSGVDTDCTDSGDWLSSPHNLGAGQYNICCRNPVPGVETGDAVVEARGFVPNQANYRARRETKLMVQLGNLVNAIQTPPADPDDFNPQRGLFDWWLARQGHIIQVEGNIYVLHYRGDGDTNDNELSQDYDPPPAPLLPQDMAAPQNDARDFSTSYPSINMLWFYNNSSPANRWPNPSARTITANVDIGGGGNSLITSPPTPNFFTGMLNQVVRRTDVPEANKWDAANWTVITGVFAGGRNANVNPSVTWLNGVPIKLARRIYQDSDNSNQIWYTGGEVVGGSRADVLIDVRTSNVELRNKYLICEGDIAVRGTNRIRTRFSGSIITPRYPVFGTKYGRIISNEPLETLPLSESERQRRRQIAGLIYSESGEVNLNYLEPPESGSSVFQGNLVYGYRITLDGRISIRYRPNLISNNGFDFSAGLLSWSEQ